ncbi:enoyl-CoA hydratase/carnithine racemase [Sphingomonas zeicaulis]|uniref:crotonase/enoyl-CoA hydratase family protein n=1 Tax=Sphingomonas zeicaulis TaxID=1632740 RepID=UPI003D20465C
MPEFSTLELTMHDGIAVATFSRPERMNTFGVAMMQDLLALIDHVDAEDAIRALVLTGSGRAFCAGADLGQGGETFDYKPGGRTGDIDVDGVRRDGGGRVTLRMFRCLKPIIAAINGAAVGIGATMLLPMDARLAASSARFGFVFARRGITPEACSGWFLPRLVGVPTALDWIYSGRIFDAAEAQARGLVQAIHAPEDLLDAAIAHAHALTAQSAPVSIALARQMIWQGLAAAHPMDMHRVDSRALQARGRSADAREGITAFLEKREARFPDVVSTGMPDFFPWAEELPFR